MHDIHLHIHVHVHVDMYVKIMVCLQGSLLKKS